MRLNKFFTLCFLFAMPGLSFAAREQEAHKHHKDHLAHFELSGYLLGSYNYLERSRRFTSGTLNRVNGIAANGFRLDQAYAQIVERPEQGLGGFLSGMIGEDAILTAPSGWDPAVFNLRNFGATVTEGYFLYRYNAFTVKAGQMLSLQGIESMVFTEDTNYSRSIVDGYTQSGKHIGIRGIWQYTDNFSAIIGMANGSGTVRKAGQLKALELGVDYEIINKFNLNVNLFTQNAYITAGATAGPKSRIYMLDIFGTYDVTKQLQFAWNLDFGQQSKATLPTSTGSAAWSGVDGYVNYHFNDKWRTSVRGEVLDDNDGYRTGVRQVWKELTVTFGYTPIKHVELIAEARHDFSNQAAFVNKGSTSSSNNQQSYTLAVFITS